MKSKFNVDNIANFLEKHGTFSLELEVAKALSGKKIHFKHSGQYIDVETNKAREYDFLIDTNISKLNRVIVSIEVKSFNSKSVLLAHTLPRKLDQAFHCIFQASIVEGNKFLVKKIKDEINQSGISYYEQKKPVGISLQRVSFDSGKIKHVNGDVHEKLRQAISVCQSFHLSVLKEKNKANILYLPIVVVPNNSIWQVEYDKEFNRKLIHQVDQVSVKCSHSFSPNNNATNYLLSHYEVCTLHGFDLPGQNGSTLYVKVGKKGDQNGKKEVQPGADYPAYTYSGVGAGKRFKLRAGL